MAVVQYSAIVNQMRGKLGGSVFNKSKNANTVQRKQQQPIGARGFQSEVRNFFSKFQRTWKELTTVQRTNWQVTANNNPTRDRFGNLTTLSGYNQFVKASMLAEYANAALPTTPYTGAAPANLLSSFFIDDLAFTQLPSGSVRATGTINFSTSVTGVPWYIIVDLSVPVSAGVMTYHGRWSNALGFVTSGSGTISLTVDLGTKYPMPVGSEKVYSRARLLHATSGTVVQEVVELAY